MRSSSTCKRIGVYGPRCADGKVGEKFLIISSRGRSIFSSEILRHIFLIYLPAGRQSLFPIFFFLSPWVPHMSLSISQSFHDFITRVSRWSGIGSRFCSSMSESACWIPLVEVIDFFAVARYVAA